MLSVLIATIHQALLAKTLLAQSLLAQSLLAKTLLAKTLLAHPLLASLLLLAQDTEEAPKQYNVVWGFTWLCVVLGLMITLRASKREPVKDKPLDV